jgi:hypothetical protein
MEQQMLKRDQQELGFPQAAHDWRKALVGA